MPCESKEMEDSMHPFVNTTIQNLKRRQMNGYYVETIDQMNDRLHTLIPSQCTVGCGDSVTLEQLGVFDTLRAADVIFYDKHAPCLTSVQKREIYLKNFDADVFISGCNAITAEGELLFIDGNGSRVAPILYGPRRVILIAGTNKLTETAEEGRARARQIAAPLDAQRLKKTTPCVQSGRCVDCRSKDRICNAFVSLSRQFDPERVHVILVEGTYGY